MGMNVLTKLGRFTRSFCTSPKLQRAEGALKDVVVALGANLVSFGEASWPAAFAAGYADF